MVGAVDLKAEAKLHLDLTRAGIAFPTMTNLTDDPRIHHVRYIDFIADQIHHPGFYEFAGREPPWRPRMCAQLPRRQQGATGTASSATPRNCVTDIGEDLDALLRSSVHSVSGSGVPIENRALCIRAFRCTRSRSSNNFSRALPQHQRRPRLAGDLGSGPTR